MTRILPEMVATIKKMLENYWVAEELAEQFGVSPAQIEDWAIWHAPKSIPATTALMPEGLDDDAMFEFCEKAYVLGPFRALKELAHD